MMAHAWVLWDFEIGFLLKCRVFSYFAVKLDLQRAMFSRQKLGKHLNSIFLGRQLNVHTLYVSQKAVVWEKKKEKLLLFTQPFIISRLHCSRRHAAVTFLCRLSYERATLQSQRETEKRMTGISLVKSS